MTIDLHKKEKMEQEHAFCLSSQEGPVQPTVTSSSAFVFFTCFTHTSIRQSFILPVCLTHNTFWKRRTGLVVLFRVDSHITHIETADWAEDQNNTTIMWGVLLQNRTGACATFSAFKSGFGFGWSNQSQTLQSKRWLVLSSRPTVSLLLVSRKSS